MTDTTTAMQVFSGGEREREEIDRRSLPFPPSTEFGKFYQPFGYIAERDEGGRDWSR